MDMEFRSLKELYNRVVPALTSKKHEFRRKKIDVTEEEIWAYLSKTIFRESKNLRLNDIVSCIMHLEENDIREYLENKDKVA